MKKPSQHLIAEVPCRQLRASVTIGVDLGDVWSHYCTLNEDAEVIDRGRFRTTPKAIEKWFADVPQARIAMEAGTHSLDFDLHRCRQYGHFEPVPGKSRIAGDSGLNPRLGRRLCKT